jgi:hypothetical protein
MGGEMQGRLHELRSGAPYLGPTRRMEGGLGGARIE